MDGTCSAYGEEEWHVQGILGGGPRRKWEDNIKMDLQGSGMWGMDWIELAQNRDS